MRRGYTKEAYLDIVSRLRRLMPEISLSTDIIVGFPGETDRDFAETVEVLREVRFASLFSFRYSPRPLTAASRLEDSVPKEEKQRRLEEVQRLQRTIQLEDHGRLVGKTKKVLCLGHGQRTPDLFAGRSEGNQVVNFRSNEDPVGRFVEVRITAFGPFSLSGERVA
jgi:tRNA-2-methylthio-N6-dimethylallyladenosine synthase